MAKSNESKGTGVRYTSEQKQEIAKYLKENSGERGYIARTMEKFGVSYVTIRNILNGKVENSRPGPKKDTPKSEKGAKVGRKPTNAFFIRFVASLKKDHERLGKRIAKMEGTLVEK